MLYLTWTQKRTDGNIYYRLFETHTESIIEVTDKTVIKLITKSGMKVKNVNIVNGKIEIKDWPNCIAQYSLEQDLMIMGASYILLSKLKSERFKVISSLGSVGHIDATSLKKYIEKCNVANCSYNAEKQEYKSLDTYDTNTTQKFINHIDKKYDEFKAKASLLGLNIDFEYSIENEDVKLRKYTGKSDKVILPSFITTICKGAFRNKGIKEIALNEGLKYIGSDAFTNNNIECIEIPKTVKFVGQSAFDSKDTGSKIYIKLNTNTVIIN